MVIDTQQGTAISSIMVLPDFCFGTPPVSTSQTIGVGGPVIETIIMGGEIDTNASVSGTPDQDEDG